MNNRLIFILPLVLAAAALLIVSPSVPSAHASPGTGLVCIVFPSTATTCPASSPTIGPLTVGSSFTLGVFISGSDAMGGFDIYVKSDPTFVTPTSAALGPLIVTPSLTSICVNGSAQTGSCTVGTANGVGVVEVTTIEGSGGNECGSISPCSGLAFTITYSVVGATASTNLTYPSAAGCGNTSISGTTECVLVADNIGTALLETIQTPAATITQMVTVDPTSTSVSCTPGSVNVGVSTSCTATVTDTATSPTNPTGTVMFSTSGTGIFSPNPCPSLTASGTNAGKCSVTYVPTALGTGPHNIGAVYSGDGTHATSTAPTFALTVTAPFDYSLSNSGPVSIVQASSGPVTIKATLTAGSAVPVTLSCATPLPTGVSCNFASPTVTPTLAGATDVLTISTMASTPTGLFTLVVNGSPVGATASGATTTVSVTVTAIPFDYSLSNNGPITVQQGSSAAVTITATLKTGTSQPVTLSCMTPLPTGVSCSFAAGSNPVTPTGSSVLTISTSASTPLGPLTVMVTGAPLGATTTPTSVSVTVTAVPFDYSLSNNGPVSITAGSSGTVTVTATLKAGTAQMVTLSCVSSSLPVGITCGSFTVNPVTPTGSSVLTINVAASVAAGPYSFTVTGAPLGVTTTPTTVSVTVTIIPFDYSLSNNGPVSITQGSSSTVTVTATLKAGSTQPVTLSCSGLPVGITCGGFTVNPVTPTGSSVLTINVASSVAAGPYTFTVTGSPLGATTTPTTVSVTVTAIPFDYALSNNGPVSVVQGSSGTVTITAKLTAGTAQPITLSCSGLPAGITCGTFTMNPVTPTLAGATSVLTVNVAPSVATGSHSFMVTGSPAGATLGGATTTVSVTVTAVPFDYSLSNNGPITIQQGSSGPVTVTATLKAGSSQPVTLSCVTPLPTGVSCSFAAGSNPVTPTGSSVLTISTSASTPPGPLTVVVTGAPLGATTTPSSISVTVTPVPFDYSLSNNGPVSITAASSGTVTITATLKAGTTQTVTLSCVSSSLPVGITCGSFTVNPVTPTGSSVLTIDVAASVAPGPYSFTVTGSPLGATTTPTTVSVTVTAAPFDYSLSNNGPVSITQGSSGTVTVTATLTAGTAQPVTLSCSGLPAGLTCGSFTVNPVTPALAGATSVLTINVASTVAAGSHTFTVTGSPLGATTAPTTVTVSVTALPFDYSLSNNGPVSITAGSSGTVTVTATLGAGVTQMVTLSCVSSSLPVGVACGSFTVNPVTPTGSSVLTINVAASVAAGPYSFTVTGSPLGATTIPTTVSLTVTVTAPHATSTSISCDSPAVVNHHSVCTATVTDIAAAGATNPSGTVTFSNGGASGTFTPANGVCTLSNVGTNQGTCQVIYAPTAVGTGTQSIGAIYAGDSGHSGSTAPNFVLTVNKASPTLSTLLSSNSITIGNTVSDSATLTGGFSPTGTVTYTAYSDSACTTLVFTSSSIPLGTPSGAFSPSAPGTYFFVASYSGDGNNNAVTSTCGATGETLTVTSLVTPTITSTVTPSSITIGGSASDLATLTGGSSPTGTVTYTAYSDSACTVQVFTDTEPIGTASKSFTPASAATYFFISSYSGDANNNAVATTCGAAGETLTVATAAKGSSTINTVVFDAATNAAWAGTETTGASAYDTATVTTSGTIVATGTVTYTFFTNGGCTGTGASAGTVALSATGSVPNSNTVGPLTAGSYSFQAVYSGDNNYAGSTSSCEPFSVAVPPTLNPTTTTIACLPGSVLVNTATRCTARVTDTSLSPTTPTGTVSFTTNRTGTFSPSATCALAASSGKSTATCTVSYTSTVSGQQMITGSYSGDSSHAQSSGSFVLNVRSPPKGQTSLSFTGFDLDDYDNGVGQLQVFVNGQLVADIPAGLNQLSGSGDYNAYTDRAVAFGPFDITSLLVSGQNSILFKDPTSFNHFGIVRNVLIVQGSTFLLHVSGAGGVSPGSSFSYTFSNPPLKISGFASSPAPANSNQVLTFSAKYTGGTAPFKCIFRFGDGESKVVAGSSGTCSVTHDYDEPGTFTATVTVRGSSTSDRVRSSLTINVTGDSS